MRCLNNLRFNADTPLLVSPLGRLEGSAMIRQSGSVATFAAVKVEVRLTGNLQIWRSEMW